VLGSNPLLADSDSDGFSDALEYHNHSNPLDAHDNPLLPHETATGAAGLHDELGAGNLGGGQLTDATDLH
jgi:hypothetical protein